MKKTKKALASLAIASMILATVPFNAFAVNTVPTRLAGTTAAQTAVAIADQTGWTGTAILASSTSYGMVDALTAGPLASYLKAPILLTGAESTLDAATKAELVKLNVTKVYVTSGTAVIKQSVLNELVAMGITVTPLGGVDRAATSVNIASKMVGVTKVAVANGLQDALSIAAIASAANEPILLTDKAALPASVAAFLTANPGITSSDVIGGTGIISDAVKAALPSATRHAGMTAYDTNNQLIQDFASSLMFDNVYVANGVTGIDALAGAPLAAQTKSAIVLTDGTVPAVATFVSGKLAAGSVVTALGGAAVVSDSVLTGVKTGVVTPPTGALSVTSVTAASATSFKVVFNQAPADTTKVKIDVKRSTTPVTTTTTWNTAKTEATVASSQNLPEGSYAVAVKNDATDLGTSTVAITAQKVAKINITSTKLAVTTTGGAIQTGYATYAIFDQYGNDVTTSSLANNVHFQSGVTTGDIKAKDGVLTLIPNANISNLMQFATVVITAYDTTTGVSTTATLTTSTQVGSLSDIKLNSLKNVDNKTLTAGDSTSLFYADYTATDISGNPTKNYGMVKGGLILNQSIVTDGISTSSSYVTAAVVEDPTDTSKAVIEVKVVPGTVLSMDMPITITAMTWTGKSSSLNITLKKAATVDTFTLMAPAFDIAKGDTKDIPFVAYDQNGVAMTKASDLSSVVFSGNVIVGENVDGTLKLQFKPTGTGQQTLTAMTSTGKYSSININVQDPALADSLLFDSSVLINAMQANATQSVDFGYNYGGLSVKDQYGRVMDLTKTSALYEVLAISSGSVSVTGTDHKKAATDGASITNLNDFGASDAVAYGGNGIKITANVAGPGTVKFYLIKKADVETAGVPDAAKLATIKAAIIAGDTTKVVSSKTATLSVLQNTDIKSYAIDAVAKPIYTFASTTGAAITERQNAYSANPSIYGATATGSKVVLAGTPIIGAYVDNSTDFSIDYGTTPISNTPGGKVAYDGVCVAAKPLANNVTEASTNLTVTFIGADGAVKSLSTPIKSSTVLPQASTIAAAVGTFMPGVSQDGDVITISASYLAAGKSMARYDANGTNDYRTSLYFLAVDSYGTKAMPLAQIVKVSEVDTATGLVSSNHFDISSDGWINTSAQAGTTIKLSGITTNGLVKTIKIIVQ